MENYITSEIAKGNLEFDSNYPGGAYYDRTTDTYYNRSGEQLRDMSEYDPFSEGYTPFGDE